MYLINKTSGGKQKQGNDKKVRTEQKISWRIRAGKSLFSIMWISAVPSLQISVHVSSFRRLAQIAKELSSLINKRILNKIPFSKFVFYLSSFLPFSPVTP